MTDVSNRLQRITITMSSEPVGSIWIIRQYILYELRRMIRWLCIVRQQHPINIQVNVSFSDGHVPIVVDMGSSLQSSEMDYRNDTIDWQESMNDVTIDCTLDVAVHPSDSDTILLTVPGVDGSIDGYQDKYKKIAESIREQHGAAVVRMNNPFISSFHWDSNVRQAIDYIQQNAKDISSSDTIDLVIMGHSAGASVVAHVAHDYPFITRLLLTNPAVDLSFDKIAHGLQEFGGNKINILIGDQDHAMTKLDEITKIGESYRMRTIVLEGIDHDFSGKAGMNMFLSAPHTHLLSDLMY